MCVCVCVLVRTIYRARGQQCRSIPPRSLMGDRDRWCCFFPPDACSHVASENIWKFICFSTLISHRASQPARATPLRADCWPPYVIPLLIGLGVDFVFSSLFFQKEIHDGRCHYRSEAEIAKIVSNHPRPDLPPIDEKEKNSFYSCSSFIVLFVFFWTFVVDFISPHVTILAIKWTK